MSGLVDLAEGFGQMLDTAGLGVWKSSGVWGDTDTAITMRALPQSPDLAIAITAYSVDDQPFLDDSTAGIQFHFRGDTDPATVQALDDSVFALIQGLTNTVIGGVNVVLIWRQSGGPLPQDQNLRWEAVSTYYVRINLPTPHRPD